MTDLRTWMTLLEGGPVSTSSLLLELDYYDKSPMGRVLARNRGRWIHFTNGAPNRPHPGEQKLVPMPKRDDYALGGYRADSERKRLARDTARAERMNALQRVPKLGINPKPTSHRDPYGIYFYPVDFLLTGTESIRDGQQYGLNMAYYFIVDINLHDPAGIVLNTVTWEQVEAIATRNGWIDKLQAFRALPPEQQKAAIASYAKLDIPGSVMWHFVERMAGYSDGSGNRNVWNTCFRGISFLRDQNGSIIHKNEPDQILVLNPRVIKVIEQGDTKAITNTDDRYGFKGHQYALMNIVKAIRGEVGGDLQWDKKKPTLTFQIGKAQFTLTLSDGYGSTGINVSYTLGRSTGGFHTGSNDLRDKSAVEIVDSLLTQARRIAARKSDLLFRPVLNSRQAAAFLTEVVGDGHPLTITETISNDSSKDKYLNVHTRGVGERTVDGMVHRTDVRIDVHPHDFDLGVTLSIDGQGIATCYSMNRFTPEQQDEALDDITAKVIESLEHHFRQVSPENTYAKSYARFADATEWAAYKGWVALTCGLNLGGRLRDHYAADIAVFEQSDRKLMTREFRYKLGNLKLRF